MRALSTLGPVFLALAAVGCKGSAGDTAGVSNAAPSVAAVFLTPDPAVAEDALRCSYTGFEDAEGDPDLSTLRWTVNGTEGGDGETLSTGFARGDTVECTVTPFDGQSEGEPVSASLSIANAPPSVALAVISPQPAASDDVLTCSWQGFQDPDGDKDQSLVTWAVNGINEATGPELAGGFGGGDEVTCFVTPFDGELEGEDVSASVFIDNVAPTIDSVQISPDPAVASDTLVCSWTGYADADGDPDQSSASWRVNGTVVGSGRTLASGFTSGDVVECVVTPFDGKDSGPTRTGAISISDSPPSITGVSISPPDPGSSDTLICEWEGFSDPDGGEDRSKVEWSVNGSAVGSGSSLAGAFAAGDDVSCEVTPFDGSSEGAPMSATTSIGNGPPTVASVRIAPDPAYVDDTLSCSWSGYSDPDGDADQSIVSWSVNGLSAGTGPSLSGVFTGRDTVQCTVTPYDGSEAGVGVATSLVVTNSIPSITGVTLSPEVAFADDTLTCTWEGFFDADGDNDQTTVSWTVNGVAAGFGVSLSGVFTGNDLVECTVTPSDGHDTGTPMSDSVVIGGSTPSVTGVHIEPAPAVAGDSLTCDWTFVDLDGDADQSTVSWQVNGSPAGEGNPLVGGFAGGDEVQCTVTPDDGTITGTPQSTTITINSPPSVSTVEILPEDAGAGDTLSCTWTGFSDPDGDPDQSLSRWEVEGADAGAGDSPSLGYARDDEVRCIVTPSDGYSSGTEVAGSLIVGNTAPSLDSATISPESPESSDTLSCVLSGYDDVDGDANASYINWYVNGALVATGTDTLDSGFGGNDEIMCEGVPYDGFDEGEPVSDTVTTGNTPPQMLSVEIEPDPLLTDDLAVAVAVGSDADGDTVSYAYQWVLNAIEVPGATGDTFDGTTEFDKDDVVWVEVTPNDGSEDGDALLSSLRTVQNSPPSLPEIEIEADGLAAEGDDLLCQIVVASDDADGDSISYEYQWFRDGLLFADFDDTISASDTSVGEAWQCFVTADDGDDEVGPVSTSVEIIAGASRAPDRPHAWGVGELKRHDAVNAPRESW